MNSYQHQEEKQDATVPGKSSDLSGICSGPDSYGGPRARMVLHGASIHGDKGISDFSTNDKLTIMERLILAMFAVGLFLCILVSLVILPFAMVLYLSYRLFKKVFYFIKKWSSIN